MRVLLVNYEYPPLGGGGGVLTRILADELSQQHEVTVLTTRSEGMPRDAYEGHVRVVRTGVIGRRDTTHASTPSLLTFGPSARRTGAWLARTHAYDVVHTFFAVPSGPAGSAIARRLRVPHVLTVIGADVHDPSRMSPSTFAPMRLVVRRVVRGAAAVTAISGDIARRAAALTGREDVRVVSCGIPLDSLPAPDRASLGWDAQQFVVVVVARLVKRKALDVLVRAVASLPPDVRLEVIGDGPEREALERIAPSERVRFNGALPTEEVQRMLVSADAFALASMHEGFGLVYLEAMQARVAVVAANAGGQTDFLHDGVNALLVPPNDAPALAAAIGRLRDDAELRGRIAAAGYETARRYTAEAMAAEYVDVYRGVTESGARSAPSPSAATSPSAAPSPSPLPSAAPPPSPAPSEE
jgi:glycosyltransferase involved in cell wall biosynthesis